MYQTAKLAGTHFSCCNGAKVQVLDAEGAARLLKAAHPQVIAAHGGRITALAVVALPRQGRREAEEQDGRREAEEQEETEAHVGEEELVYQEVAQTCFTSTQVLA